MGSFEVSHRLPCGQLAPAISSDGRGRWLCKGKYVYVVRPCSVAMGKECLVCSNVRRVCTETILCHRLVKVFIFRNGSRDTVGSGIKLMRDIQACVIHCHCHHWWRVEEILDTIEGSQQGAHPSCSVHPGLDTAEVVALISKWY